MAVEGPVLAPVTPAENNDFTFCVNMYMQCIYMYNMYAYTLHVYEHVLQ